MSTAELELLLGLLDETRRDVLTAVAPLSDEQWRISQSETRPERMGPGWDPASIVGYLAWGDFAAKLACSDPLAWKALLTEAGATPDAYINAHALRWGRRERTELVSTFVEGGAALTAALRAKPAGTRFAWFDGFGYSPIEMVSLRLDTYRRSLQRFPRGS